MGWTNHIANMDDALDWRDHLALATDPITNDLGQLCPNDAQEVIDEIEQLQSALQVLFNSYKELADSGDAGFWSLEDTPQGKQAMTALGMIQKEGGNDAP